MSFFIRQHLNPSSGALSYLLVDPVTRGTALIDAFDDCVDDYCAQVKNLGLDIRLLLYTGGWNESRDSCQLLKARTGARLMLHESITVMPADHYLHHGETLYLGELMLNAYHTPGYAADAMVFRVDNLLFTGRTLLAGGLPQAESYSDIEKWYASVHDCLYHQPDDYLIYPGQLYHCRRVSCVAQEKHCNELLPEACDAPVFFKRMQGDQQAVSQATTNS